MDQSLSCESFLTKRHRTIFTHSPLFKGHTTAAILPSPLFEGDTSLSLSNQLPVLLSLPPSILQSLCFSRPFQSWPGCLPKALILLCLPLFLLHALCLAGCTVARMNRHIHSTRASLLVPCPRWQRWALSLVWIGPVWSLLQSQSGLTRPYPWSPLFAFSSFPNIISVSHLFIFLPRCSARWADSPINKLQFWSCVLILWSWPWRRQSVHVT